MSEVNAFPGSSVHLRCWGRSLKDAAMPCEHLPSCSNSVCPFVGAEAKRGQRGIKETEEEELAEAGQVRSRGPCSQACLPSGDG